jgi:hypothetical protein
MSEFIVSVTFNELKFHCTCYEIYKDNFIEGNEFKINIFCTNDDKKNTKDILFSKEYAFIRINKFLLQEAKGRRISFIGNSFNTVFNKKMNCYDLKTYAAAILNTRIEYCTKEKILKSFVDESIMEPSKSQGRLFMNLIAKGRSVYPLPFRYY